MPNGGMNEAGLVIEVLWLSGVEYPSPLETKNTVNELQWLQYHLDNHSTVEEVLQSDVLIQIVPVFAPLHYFVADRQGNAAVVEYINGKLVAHTGNELKHTAITNDTYDKSEEYLAQHDNEQYMSRNASFKRFERIAQLIREFNNQKPAVEYAFQILDSVWVRNWTRWNMVYDLQNRQIQIRTDKHRQIRVLNFADFDFTKDASVLYYDINTDAEGNIRNQFTEHNGNITYELLKATTKDSGLEISDSIIHCIAFVEDKWTELEKLTLERCSQTVNLMIVVENLKHSRGNIRIGLFKSEEDFHNQEIFTGGIVTITDKKAQLMVYQIARGDYSVVVFHDENGNGKLDRNKLGVPKEPYNFSNDAKKILRLPKYESTKITLDSERETIRIAL